MINFVFWNDFNDSKTNNVGGKAESLSRLIQLRMNVPNFFVIPSNVFLEYIQLNDLETKIFNLINDKNYLEIKRIINEIELSKDFIENVNRAVTTLGTKMVSVRSSATNEDGLIQSYAGQYASFLFVNNLDIATNIKKCWASYFNQNAIEYNDGKLSLKNQGMAVIVQSMIDADISGVAFSKNPATGDDCCLIEAAHGTGESIVSGLLTPNKIEVDNNTSEIKNLSSNEKHKKGILSLKQIHEIHSNVCLIREEYGLEVDTEWCYDKNGKLYFLQARPITSIVQRKNPYKKTLTRPFSLLRIQLYRLGEFNGIKSITNGNYYFNPLFISNNGVTNIYYNFLSQKENPVNMFAFLNNAVDFVEYEKQCEKSAQSLSEIISDKNKFNIDSIILNLVKIYPFSSLGNLAGTLPKHLVGKCYNIFENYRSKYDGLITETEEFLCSIAAEKNLNDSDYLTLDEIFEKSEMPTNETIAVRKKGFIYFNEEIIPKSDDNVFNEYLNENNIQLEDDNSKNSESDLLSVKGDVAYNGVARGKACKVFSKNDLDKFQEGDILVSPMTIPTYINAMRKARAIITDEGGITCHAAIVARELKIPCIVGTKRATSTFADGDILDVDANNGIITKIFNV